MYSAIGDNFKDNFPHQWPNVKPETFPVGVSQAEFDALKKEIQELKKLLKAAKAFDKATNQPHCEVEDKIKLIRQIAKLVGVSLEDLAED